jgi:hypothetical protein
MVLEPPELIELFRKTAQGLAQLYGGREDGGVPFE